MSVKNLFNKDYYENGVNKKVSGYENFRWMPTRSIPEALEIIENFQFDTCVDYGCAKGFLVHALRILGKEAFGEDISEYAISTGHKNIKEYISLPNEKKYDLLICKDVLEHIQEEELSQVLQKLKNKANEFLFVIPLGDNDLFRIKEYEIDITHVTKKDEEWWINLFKKNGFKLKRFSYSLGSMKNKWTKIEEYGNGFFILTK